ncbi:tyrosine-type recombinase/integrase [Acidiferrobacter sp.]|uniref:tyrosine-type recombinase/integrase n=1 Tax=Acidiferrobacter sp. TaxID=1872107 RepID=UPI002619AE38|nr:tyrosine-type recombinase/integrase [Acidiferrobacter sp.]
MSALRQALADYLTVRRSLGFKLHDSERLLNQFVAFLEERAQEHVTIEAAVAWATLPIQGHRRWLNARLTIVRRFAIHLRGIDSSTEVPPSDLLPGQKLRATPYLYSGEEIAALMQLSATLLGSYRQATYRTLIGLLTVTGMRIGEAIALDQSDLDIGSGVLTIRVGKFGKSRVLPLHPSTLAALGEYLCRSDRPPVQTNALLVSTMGKRLHYNCVHNTFKKLVQRAGIAPRSAACRPRLHDLRHGFAVNTILDGYRDNGDPSGRLALLSTYLGHTDPAHTYWYLSAAPELLKLVGDRLERHLGGAK